MSSTKYNGRSPQSIFLNSTENIEPDWYNDFLSNLQKQSVSSQKSIYDEISSILGNTKSKYSSVEEAVQDMKERTGLKAFLDSKQALAAIQGQEPAIFQKIPEMKIFIDNFIETRPGTSIESVIHDLFKVDQIRNKLEDRTVLDDDVKSYINSKLAEIQNQNLDHNKIDMNLGKVDQSLPESSNDPLAICEPNKES